MPVTKYTEEDANIFDNPKINIKRSKFNLSHTLTTSFGIGRLVPIYWDEVLPGDTFKIDTGLVARIKQAFIKPVMDPLYLDIYYFYCPNRIVWKHWKEFIGHKDDTPWTPTTTYTVPMLRLNTQAYTSASIISYLGAPTTLQNVSGNYTEISQLPLRVFNKIYNNFFLNQATQNPLVETDDDTSYNIYTASGGPNLDLLGVNACPFVNKLPDLFTRALPEPQRGDSMKLPFATNAPVIPLATEHTTGAVSVATKIRNSSGGQYTGVTGLVANGANFASSQAASGTVYDNVHFTNLYADLTNAAGTINDLIQAYQVQRLLWTDGVYGGRYKEILYGHFGVLTSDKTLQIPEYLGGAHINLNTYQVVQNSSTDSTSAQGNITAFGYAEDYSENVIKSFEEHGIVMGLAVVRFKHSYQQGINKKFSKKNRYDYYWPELANLPDMPIKTKELYATGVYTNDDSIFGYGEAWYEYKQNYNRVSGQMITNSLTGDDEYHWADWYTSKPVIANFSVETSAPTNFDRTLSVQNSQYDNILLNIAFNIEATRPMPARSVPGFTIWG